ncbi:tetratricopeptide repeat protein [Rapidithrix thailandica]|uniref:Tetratricopeptide repeat protein n=1 Tax=Rapidithrix thailandica TaxID=413964 RepID=A0AAW9S8X5_9BACT
MKKHKKKQKSSISSTPNTPLYFYLDLPAKHNQSNASEKIDEWAELLQYLVNSPEHVRAVLPSQSSNLIKEQFPVVIEHPAKFIELDDSNALEEQLSASGFAVVFHQNTLNGVKALEQWYMQQVSLSQDTVYIGVDAVNTRKQRLKKLCESVWTPNTLKGIGNGLNLVPVKFLENYLAEELHRESPCLASQRLQKTGWKWEEMPVSLDEDTSFFRFQWAVWSSLCKNFVKQNFTNPWTEMRKSTDVWKDLQNGNFGLYRLSFVFLILFLLFFMPFLSFDFGNTWDEWTHVDYARDILDFYLSWGENQAVFDLSKHTRYAHLHYGASFDTLAEFVYRYLSPFGIYETRHLLNALFGVLIIWFTGRIAKAYGSWRAALLAAILLLCSPRFLGHSMNNPKDIPFALGYAIGLFYLLRFLKQLPRPTIGTVFWLSFGIAFTISSKIGGLILVGYLGLFTGIVWLYHTYAQGLKVGISQVPRYGFLMLVVIAVGYFGGLLLWPQGLKDPIHNPLQSLQEFTNFRFLIAYELFEGKRILMENPPGHYTFKWIWISVPLFVHIGFLLGILPVPQRLKQYKGAILLFLLFTFLFPIGYTIVKNSTLYSGWRHMLFTFIPMIVIVAAGWEYLFTLSKKKMINFSLAGLLLVLTGLPVYWMVKNHPNEYVYFNELTGGINGAYTHYETEYWSQSLRQAVEWLVENEPVKDKKIVIATNFEVHCGQYYAEKYSDKIQIVWTRENEKYRRPWDYAFFGSRTMSKEQIENTFPPKNTIHTIKADTVPLVAIVKRQNNYLPKAFEARSQGKAAEALEYARKAMEADPANVEALRMNGILLIGMRRYEEALQILENCLRLSPEDYVCLTLIGTALYSQEEYNQAVPFLKQAIECKINNVSAYHNLGRIYIAQKNYPAALKYLQEGMKYDTNKNYALYFDAGVALIQQGLRNPKIKINCFRMAIQSLEKSLKINPNYSRAYRNLAYIYSNLGNQQKAQHYLQMMNQRLQRN